MEVITNNENQKGDAYGFVYKKLQSQRDGNGDHIC